MIAGCSTHHLHDNDAYCGKEEIENVLIIFPFPYSLLYYLIYSSIFIYLESTEKLFEWSESINPCFLRWML